MFCCLWQKNWTLITSWIQWRNEALDWDIFLRPPVQWIDWCIISCDGVCAVVVVLCVSNWIRNIDGKHRIMSISFLKVAFTFKNVLSPSLCINIHPSPAPRSISRMFYSRLTVAGRLVSLAGTRPRPFLSFPVLTQVTVYTLGSWTLSFQILFIFLCPVPFPRVAP